MRQGMFKKAFRNIIRASEEGHRIDEAVLRLLDSVKHVDSLLDIGCADGSKTMAYAELAGVAAEAIKGVEGQEKYRMQAADKFEAFPLDIEKEKLPFEDESFGLVVCNQVLEHLKNIFLPLSEMDRVLKVKGYLLIGIPNLAALHNRFLLMFGRQPLCNFITGPHIRCFAHRDFLKFIETNNNFEVIKVSSALLYPFPYPLNDWLGRSLHGLSAYTFYLLLKKKHDPSTCGWDIRNVGDTLLV